MMQRFSFYGFRDLQDGDISFAWECPPDELEGCYCYELRRQMVARVLANAPDNSVPEWRRVREAFEKTFMAPWSALPADTKAAWHRRWQSEVAMPMAEIGPEMPGGDLPGAVYAVKIDWDLTDKEILRRFKSAMEAKRPRPPIRERTETITDMLRAIAAQRITDCRGGLPIMRALEEFTLCVPTYSKEASGRMLFASEQRLAEARVRYAQQERELQVAFSKAGELDICLRPG